MYTVRGLNRVSRAQRRQCPSGNVIHELRINGLVFFFLLQLKALRDKTAMHMLALLSSRVDKEDLLATIPRINSDWPQPRAGASTQS